MLHMIIYGIFSVLDVLYSGNQWDNICMKEIGWTVDMNRFVYIVNSILQSPCPMPYENIGLVFVCNDLSAARKTWVLWTWHYTVIYTTSLLKCSHVWHKKCNHVWQNLICSLQCHSAALVFTAACLSGSMSKTTHWMEDWIENINSWIWHGCKTFLSTQPLHEISLNPGKWLDKAAEHHLVIFIGHGAARLPYADICILVSLDPSPSIII